MPTGPGIVPLQLTFAVCPLKNASMPGLITPAASQMPQCAPCGPSSIVFQFSSKDEKYNAGMLFAFAQVKNCRAKRLAFATDGTAAPTELPALGQPVSLTYTTLPLEALFIC